ncbi:hypothetical protein PISL3812_09774 [Talaromyces islandicus]|uniref:Myb-like domain-containing protein n=1 Tax=Talaromyces islandicus TaxID=28573 RepID=A0A0U1MAS9_TALIS|nr:hypothetical protein PISL3812_09774 [Talaromyces islandicus]
MPDLPPVLLFSALPWLLPWKKSSSTVLLPFLYAQHINALQIAHLLSTVTVHIEPIFSPQHRNIALFLPVHHPVYPNDFDRAIKEFSQQPVGVFTEGEDRMDEEEEGPVIPDGQSKFLMRTSGYLPCGTSSSEQSPSNPTASSTSPTTDNTLTQSLSADFVPPQNQDHENSETGSGNIEPVSPARPMAPSVSLENLVPTSVSTDLRLNDASPQFPTPDPISTREGKADRHKNTHTSVILDSPDVESSVQSVPHNGEAHRQGTSTVSQQDTTSQSDEPATDNETASISSLPSIAVVMPVSSRCPITSSKRTLSSNQGDLEPLLHEDDNDPTPSDDEDDADYIDDDDIPEANKRPPASKRRKISPRARSSRMSRETRLSKKLGRSEPVQQDLGQAIKHHQTSPAPREDVYCFAGLLSYLSKMPIEDRLQFVSWLCEGALTQIIPDPSLALSPTSASTAERSQKSSWSSCKPRENRMWKPEEKALLRQLKKEEQLSWSAIEERFAERFPERRIGAIQVHWYTKLKDGH